MKIMENVSIKCENSSFLDLRNKIEINETNFIDNLHFTELGSEKFSSMLYKEINKIL